MASAPWQYASLPVERLAILSGADPLGPSLLLTAPGGLIDLVVEEEVAGGGNVAPSAGVERGAVCGGTRSSLPAASRADRYQQIGSVPPVARFRGGCACRIGALTISARHADPMRGGWVMRHPNMENCGERTRSRLDGR